MSLGSFQANPAKTWSENAAAIAGAACASYRVIGGAIDLLPLGAETHSLAITDGTLQPEGLTMVTGRDLVNDVIISGAREAGAYVTQVFIGDGSTSEFLLPGAPFRGLLHSGGVLISDSFQAAVFDAQTWMVSDPGSHLSAGSAGLTMSGGDGLDGDTWLGAIDGVELGGGLVFEADGVVLAQASDGVLLGIYSGPTSRANCLAGFNVKQTNGATTVQPLVNGSPTGSLQVLLSGHSYVLRLRTHCVRTQRVGQTYHVLSQSGLLSFGGALIDAPLGLVFEVRDAGASSNTPVTVLFDGTLASSPANVAFVPINSVQLVGSIGSIRLTQSGSAWIQSTPSSGTTATRLIGLAGEGVDCTISSAGTINFFAGRVPAAGEQVLVFYRTAQRAAARLQQQASILSDAKGGLPGVSSWKGSVIEPPTRSSEDCANAAAALLSLASSPLDALEGVYEANQLSEIWPGDLLNVAGVPVGTSLLARSVVLTDTSAAPETIHSRIGFANCWAQSSSMQLSNALASDVLLPLAPLPSANAEVPDLATLSVVSVTQTTLTLDTGVTPPAGGGFEVRRIDGAFGPGTGQELVLRSPVRGFSIPREAQVERYYVRMYDASTPPVYSWRSSAVQVDVPVG